MVSAFFIFRGMEITGPLGEYFELQVLDKSDCDRLKNPVPSALSILWFQDEKTEFHIDGKPRRFLKNDILFLTEFHKLDFITVGLIQFIRFNRSFFCVIDHDQEIGCKGILFFGSSTVPVIKIPSKELRKFEGFWKMFQMELEEQDKYQVEMLQTMLKRYIILCTRIFKEQHGFTNEEATHLVREFNFLVEQHFSTKHTVADYARLLNRAPKTLSNIFLKQSPLSPLQIIQNRRVLEAKRLLGYTKKQIQEIGFQIGFEDAQSFSRFFKKQVGMSPLHYRENIKNNKTFKEHKKKL